jgi:hypothetical protein
MSNQRSNPDSASIGQHRPRRSPHQLKEGKPMFKSTSATISPPSPEPAWASTSTGEAADVHVNLQARPRRSRRWIPASVAIAAVAVISLMGTMIIRDRDSNRTDVPSGSPAAAQTQDLTPAELTEMWASADAAFAGLEPTAAVVHVPAQPTAEPDAALWASVDHMTITGGR